MKPIKKGQSCQCHPGHVIYNAKVCVPCGGASTQLPSGSVVDSFYVDQYGQCTCREGFLLDHKSSTCLPCRGHGAHVLDGKCTCQPTQARVAEKHFLQFSFLRFLRKSFFILTFFLQTTRIPFFIFIHFLEMHF